MKLRAIAMFAVLASASAWAFHCPVEMKKIDDALAKKPQLSAQHLEEVKKLRAEGEALHNKGDHEASVATLEKAKAILKIQ